MYALLRCLGQAFLKHGPKAIADLVPFGGSAYEIAVEAWRLYGEQGKSQNLPAELKAVAQATEEQFQQEAAKVIAEVAANRPPEERQHLTLYLEQIPRSIRQSLGCTSDPTGRTVPFGLRIDKAADLLPLLPARLPRFREGQAVPGTDLVLAELLGMGGVGEVWKAGNSRVPGLAPVALKFCLDPAAKDRLLHHEAEVLSRVMAEGRHPGIVQLLGTHLNADPPCLEYEYVAGGDLTRMVGEFKRGGGFDPIGATEIVRDIARTVGFMHRLNPPIVHRDLKPANVLVHRNKENRLSFKVTDFGIGAVAADRELAEHTLRPTNSGEGLTTGLRGAYTPLYASPQQQAGEPADPRDDAHALGVIWYQLLTADLGLMAIPAEWREVAEGHGLSGELLQLLGACLDGRAHRRPADAGVLAEQIQAALSATEKGHAPLPASPKVPDAIIVVDSPGRRPTAQVIVPAARTEPHRAPRARVTRRTSTVGTYLGCAAVGVILLVSVVGLTVGFGTFATLGACCCLPFAVPPPPKPVVVASAPNVAPDKQAKAPKPANKALDEKKPGADAGAPVDDDPQVDINTAHKLYGEGKRAEAVAKYKKNFASVEPKLREEILKRIVDFEADAGNLKVARRWIEVGVNQGLVPVYGSAAATKLVEQVRLEQEQPVANAKKRKEAEEAQRKKEMEAERDAQAKKALDDLQSPDPKTRLEAVRAVAELGEPAKDTIPALVGLLTDKDCQRYAAKALGRFGKAAVPHLLKVLEGKDAVARMWAVRALGQIGPDAQEAIPALVRARSDPSVSVRDAVKVALEKIKK
jgi:hypothetical protein